MDAARPGRYDRGMENTPGITCCGDCGAQFSYYSKARRAAMNVAKERALEAEPGGVFAVYEQTVDVKPAKTSRREPAGDLVYETSSGMERTGEAMKGILETDND